MALTPHQELWVAMSELFLDTEVRPAIPHVALACVRSGYDDARLEHVFKREVAPWLGHNLLVVAGEWGYFEPQWLIERLRVVPYPPGWWTRLRTSLSVVPRRDWRATIQLTRALRAVEEPARVNRARSMSFLIGAFVLYDRAYDVPKPEGLEAPEVLRSVVERDLKEVLPRLYVSGETWTVREGWERVEAAIAKAQG